MLVEQGMVDGDRMAITGGSAGGYTTLCALTFRTTFAAGCSLYGIGDLEILASDTHKFESRYLDTLVGPWPEAKAIYDERSPVNHVEKFSAPISLVFLTPNISSNSALMGLSRGVTGSSIAVRPAREPPRVGRSLALPPP